MPKVNLIIHARTEIQNPPPVFLKKLKRSLTYKNPDFEKIVRHGRYGGMYTSVPETLQLFTERPDAILVPRGVKVTALLADAQIGIDYVEDLRTDAESDGFRAMSAKFTLTDDQNLAVVSAYDHLNVSLFGVASLSLPTSAGKSVVGLEIARKLRQRTLIIVDTDLILSTWIRDCKEHLSYNPGVIQGQHFEMRDITIAMIQTLSKRKHQWDRLNRNYGTILVDECQAAATPSHQAFLTQSPAKYICGLTATMKRPDGKTFLVHSVLGEPILAIKENKTATITSVPITKVVVRMTGVCYESPGFQFDYHGYIDYITRLPARNRRIVKDVIREVNRGRICLVVTSRKEHARLLVEMLKTTGTDARLLIRDDGIQPRAVEKVVLERKCQVVVATLQLIIKGASIPPLQVLFLTTDIGNESGTEQAAGRVKRACPEIGKEFGKIYDYVDNLTSVAMRHYLRARVPVYRRLGVKKFQELTG